MPRASCTRRPGDTASRRRGRGTYRSVGAFYASEAAEAPNAVPPLFCNALT